MGISPSGGQQESTISVALTPLTKYADTVMKMDEVLRPSQLEVFVKIRADDCVFVIVSWPSFWQMTGASAENQSVTRCFRDESTSKAGTGSSSWTRTGSYHVSVRAGEWNELTASEANAWIPSNQLIPMLVRFFPFRHRSTWRRKSAVVKQKWVSHAEVTCLLRLYNLFVS